MTKPAFTRLAAVVALAVAPAATSATAARAPFKGKVCALATAKQVTAITGVSSRCVNACPEPAPGATIYVGNWAGKTPTSPRLQVSVQVYKDSGMLRLAKSNLDVGLPGPPRKVAGIGSAAYEATGGGSTAIRFATGRYVATGHPLDHRETKPDGARDLREDAREATRVAPTAGGFEEEGGDRPAGANPCPMRFHARLLLPLAVALSLVPAATADVGDPPVTVISDSVLTSVVWHQQNLDVLAQGLDLDLHVAVGRRLGGTSITFEGAAAPTLLDLVPTLPAIGPRVLVEMGYNDDPAAFRAEAEQAIELLLARGAHSILWPTLFESRAAFASMNRDLRALALIHPELILADWNAEAQGHADWFQSDRLHVSETGGAALAALLHGGLLSPTAATRPPVVLPPATVGKRFAAVLPAAAGATWSLAGGSLPAGVALGADGRVGGTPRAAGRFVADVFAESPGFLVGHERVTLDVHRAPPPKKPKRRAKR